MSFIMRERCLSPEWKVGPKVRKHSECIGTIPPQSGDWCQYILLWFHIIGSPSIPGGGGAQIFDYATDLLIM